MELEFLTQKKITFKHIIEMKSFSDVQKLEEFNTRRRELQENIKRKPFKWSHYFKGITSLYLLLHYS